MNITGGESLSLFEAQEAADIVPMQQTKVNMIFGTVINPELQDEIVVTVIATGFEDKPSSQGRASNTGWYSKQAEVLPKKTQFLRSVGASQHHQKVLVKVERIQLMKMIFQASSEIEKKDVLEELDVSRNKFVD